MTKTRPAGLSSPIRRFWENVGRGDDECWPWLGRKRPTGYGRHKIYSKEYAAHRYSYELLVGPIPAGLTLDHLCRNRECVNPAHLEAVTHAENMRRSRRSHCSHGHAFTEANTYLYPSGRRGCRECARVRHKLYVRRHAAKSAPQSTIWRLEEASNPTP